MPTVQDVLDYLGIDYPDKMVTKNIERAISTADSYLKGAIGDDYPNEDPRAKELALIVTGDLYENRSMMEKVSGNIRKLVNDFVLQLQLERRRKQQNEQNGIR